MTTKNNLTLEKDKEIIISIVNEMTKSSTGAETTKHWANDALWFDIPPFASKGIAPAIVMLDKVFNSFKTCKITILETEVILNDNIGIVCTIQKAEIIFQNDNSKTLFFRETDCFQNLSGTWKLVHQHVSVPAGGEWDGRIIKE